MIDRQITIAVCLAPEELALEFSRLDDTGQDNFFNALSAITGEWKQWTLK